MHMEYSFTEVMVEPCAGADISAMVQEMSALSKKIELPVITKFNGHEITVTPTTDVNNAVNAYFLAKSKKRRKK